MTYKISLTVIQNIIIVFFSILRRLTIKIKKKKKLFNDMRTNLNIFAAQKKNMKNLLYHHHAH